MGRITVNAAQVDIRQAVVNWFEKSVLGLNLCPFAAKPYRESEVYFEFCLAQSDEGCLVDLFLNLRRMDKEPAIETLLLICPYHFDNFEDYNQFLDLTDDLLEEEGWDGIYQIASFHPHYQFEGSNEEDRANWTNRSPYPVLHIIREASMSRALTSFPSSREIPARNLKTICALSGSEMDEIFGSHTRPSDKKIPG